MNLELSPYAMPLVPEASAIATVQPAQTGMNASPNDSLKTLWERYDDSLATSATNLNKVIASGAVAPVTVQQMLALQALSNDVSVKVQICARTLQSATHAVDTLTQRT
ncbi:hypothetical protein [Paraburkholderia hayleyella]|uniref:hypothetical protein n=1 Tax=Paraburkholderia hayleyella TaxID=2152889 RepID=UPI001580E32D|nr:hypothetical protein [Paraburkholderia hayleyella]